MAPSLGLLKLAHTHTGSCLRVEGRGTWCESRSAYELAMQSLAAGDQSLVVDLSGCDYLDSTFLGCLVGLHRRFGKDHADRFAIAVPTGKRQALFGATGLDRFIHLLETPPPVEGDWSPVVATRSSEAAAHIMESHQALADASGQPVFNAIAQRLAHELTATQGRAHGQAHA